MLAVDHLALRLGDFVQHPRPRGRCPRADIPGGPRNRRTQCVIDFAYAWCVAESLQPLAIPRGKAIPGDQGEDVQCHVQQHGACF